MKIGKIETNPIQQRISNVSKNTANSQTVQGMTILPKGVDSKYFTNISFKGEKEYVRAAGYGNLERLIYELEVNKVDINAKDGDGVNALLAASLNGQTKIVAELLSRENIDVNAQSRYFNTAL